MPVLDGVAEDLQCLSGVAMAATDGGDRHQGDTRQVALAQRARPPQRVFQRDGLFKVGVQQRFAGAVSGHAIDCAITSYIRGPQR